MEKINLEIIEQVVKLIEECKNIDVNKNLQEAKEKVGNLKNAFLLFRKKQRKNFGKIKEANMEKLKKDLLELRNKGYENIDSLNEILQLLAEDFGEQGKEEEKKEIYTEILGYEGTKCSKMSPEFIKEIIERKMDKKNEDEIKYIINVLLQSFESQLLEIDLGSYKELIEEAIIPLISGDNQEFLDKKIISVITRVAMEYKAQGDYQQALDLLKLGCKFKTVSKHRRIQGSFRKNRIVRIV